MKSRLLAVAIAGLFPTMKSAIASYASRAGLATGALVAEVDKLDAVPEAHRAWYTEKEGKFVLDLGKVEIEDVKGLKSALEKERQAVKDRDAKIRETAEIYKDIDPKKYRELMAQLDSDEELKLLKDGKVEEIWARRTEKLKADHQKQLEAKEGDIKAANERTDKFRGRVLDDNIRQAATKAGLHPQAVEDALFRARSLFQLDEAGNAVQMKDGQVVMGKDGKTPFSPAEWLDGMKEAAPHWFPVAGSGSGSGSRSSGSTGNKVMKRADFEALDGPSRAARVKDGYSFVD